MSLATPPSLWSWRDRRTQGRPWAALALAVLLLVAQGLWSAHETLHLTDGHGDDCALCLIGGGAAAGLPATLAPTVPFGARVVIPAPVLPADNPGHSVFRPQSPRAPPRSTPTIR